MINKILYGLQNPKEAFKFAKRQIYLRKIRKKYYLNRESEKTKFNLKSTKFILGANKNDIKNADKILAGNLKIYSSINIKTGEVVNWYKDYISGFIWSKDKFFTEINYNYPTGTDIKNPWEVSRFQQMITVGLAYQKTHNEKYVKYFIDQISDWIKQNPVYYSVNWMCTMEVAIRVCNWLISYDLMRNSKHLNKEGEFYQIFCGSLKEHGDYIFNNLENIGVKSNHYMSDLIGLIWLGILCPDIPNAKKWLNFALKELQKEMLHQFYNDGVAFEASTAYHRLILEMISYTVILCHNHNIKFSTQFYSRLKKAFEYTYYYTKPNGDSPQIGDNDSGRFFIFNSYFSWISLNHSYLINIGHHLFPNNLLFGLKKASDKHFALNSKMDLAKKKDYFKTYLDGNVTIIKKKNWFIYFDGNPIGQDGNGGHNHDSAGSIELSFRGQSIIVDPGTGYYTSHPNIRNYFRSKQSHNAPQIPDFNPKLPKELFTANEKYTQVKKIGKKEEIKYLLISPHYQFTRSFFLSGKKLIIEDIIKSPKKHNFDCLFTLHPSVKVVRLDKKIIINKNLLVYSNNNEISIESTKYSQNYNDIIKSKAIRFNSNKKLQIIFEPYEK